uniref:TolC family protein n=1 Tax=Eiseniibacteriota bacterium TaxID=2212470 RepID=A0A832I2F0_UNCEI
MSWRSTAAALLALGALAARPAAALDLAAALGDVAARNPSLASARATADAARARVPSAGAWSAPMLEAGLVNVPRSGRFDEDPMTMKTVGVRQRLAPWGSNGLARRAAGSAADAARAQLADARNALLGEAVAAYAAAWSAAARARTSESHLGVMDRLVQSARARYAAASGRLEDVLRAESERARTHADLAAFRAEAAAARARLDALRGVAPGAAADTLAEPALAAVPEDAAAWTAAAGASHPRLAAAGAERERWRLAARAARRMAWPELELMGEWGFRESEDAMTGEPTMDMWSARVGVMLPVFAGSRELAEAREMDAMARAAEGGLAAARLALAADLAATHAEARAAERVARLLADTVVVAQRRAVDASWSAYAAGTGDLLRVLEAAHALYADEIETTRARERRWSAQGRALALTGRPELIGLPPIADGGDSR